MKFRKVKAAHALLWDWAGRTLPALLIPGHQANKDLCSWDFSRPEVAVISCRGGTCWDGAVPVPSSLGLSHPLWLSVIP